MGNEEKAKELAQHYFELIAIGAGVQWDSDNRAEIDNLVDAIIAAAVDEVEARQLRAADEDAAGSYAAYKKAYPDV
jgi:hypothetical protein